MLLDEFFANAEHNTCITREKEPVQWGRLVAIDTLFERATIVGVELDNWLKPVLLSRAHSAYRAAARLAASGQVLEAYMVMRGCLETAVYAHLFEGRTDLRDAWLARGDSPEHAAAFRRAFRISDAWPLLDRAGLGVKSRGLYDLLIAQGAHPNDHGTANSMSVTADADGEPVLHVAHMKLGDEAFTQCLLLNECVGIMALWIFNTLYAVQFRTIGVLAELHQLTLTSPGAPSGAAAPGQ